jgi:hypothetical protein
VLTSPRPRASLLSNFDTGGQHESTKFDESIPAWEKAIYAFLAEKERRSGSMRTVDAYTRTLQRFFGTLGKTPEQITPPDVFGFAHGIGPSGREPAAITIGDGAVAEPKMGEFRYEFGGGGGIRTHERLAPLTVFKTVPINRSGTPPRYKIAAFLDYGP